MQHLDASAFFVIAPQPLQLAVVVPTLNERGNVGELLERLSVALAGIEWEILFVDDGSTDGTPEFLSDLSRRDRRVRLIRRMGRRGLSSAVLEGMLASTAPIMAVIDADLQHDERILPDLYRAVAEGADIAIGTRYAGGGSTGDWEHHRLVVSRIATWLAVAIAGVNLSDPMSGFFAINRSWLLLTATRTSGIGYKLLLDLVASSPTQPKIAEQPYTFRTRVAGASKLDAMIALQYLELLAEKMVGRWIPIRFVKFSMVGTLGVAVHLALLSIGVERLGASFRVGQTIAAIGAMCFNFLLNNQFTYRDRRLRGMRLLTGLISYCAVCGLGAVANVGVGTLMFTADGSWWLAGIAGAALSAVWNYTMGGMLTWRRPA